MKKIYKWIEDHDSHISYYAFVIPAVLVFIVGSWFLGDWIHWEIVTKPHVLTMMCDALEPSAFVDPNFCEDR